MSLTEMQLPSKTDFYNNLQNIATNMNNLMNQWSDAAAFLANMGSDDLDSMGVAEGDVRIDIVNLRTCINEMVAFFDGSSTTQTVVPEEVINKIRRMK
jgi:hypothetical protein